MAFSDRVTHSTPEMPSAGKALEAGDIVTPKTPRAHDRGCADSYTCMGGCGCWCHWTRPEPGETPPEALLTGEEVDSLVAGHSSGGGPRGLARHCSIAAADKAYRIGVLHGYRDGLAKGIEQSVASG